MDRREPSIHQAPEPCVKDSGVTENKENEDAQIQNQGDANCFL